MAATSAGAFLTAAVTVGLEPDARPWGRRDVRDRGPVREVLVATLSTAGLLSLVNVDVLLARHTLAPAAAGLYAAGAVFTKATYWGPQFLATLLYARMAGHTTRRWAVTAAVLLTVGGGAAGVLAVAVAGVAAVRLVAGPAYVGLGRTVALFAAFGTALAVVQVLVYAALAVGDRRLGVGAWLAVGAATAAVLGRPGLGLTGLVGTMLVVTSALAVAGLVLVLRGTRGGGDDGGSGPAVRDAPARAGS
jgi:hypothetical protein